MLSKIFLIRNNEKGFTLIEILIALIITAVIVSGISMAIFQVFTINAASLNRMEAVKQVENALHYINRDVESGYPSLIPHTGTYNGISYPDKLPIVTTTLSASCEESAKTVSVSSTDGFPASGQVVIDIGQYTELVNYTSKSATSFSGITHIDSQGNSVAGTGYAHIANQPISTLALHWDDFDVSNNTQIYYDAIYGLTSSKEMQKTKIISATGSTQQTTQIAKDIDPSPDNSFFAFDGLTLTIQLTASIPGFRPATETRTLQVKPRTNR